MINKNLIPNLNSIDVDKEFETLGYEKHECENGFYYINDKERSIEFEVYKGKWKVSALQCCFNGDVEDWSESPTYLNPFEIQLIWIKLWQMGVL